MKLLKNSVDNEWPDGYPEKLKPISWHISGKTAGPYRYFSKMCPYNTKGNSMFVKQVLIDWFAKNGCSAETCNDWCQWVVTKLTVWYDENSMQFRISLKKDKDKQPLFKEEEFLKMHNEQFGVQCTKKEALKFFKKALENILERYNNLV